MSIRDRKPVPIEQSAKILGDRLRCVIISKVQSTTGKYFCFLGTHYNGKVQCYDVGSYNNVTGEIVRRHYTLEGNKEEAYAYWSEFRAKMTAKREEGGEDAEKDRLTTYGPTGKLIN